MITPEGAPVGTKVKHRDSGTINLITKWFNDGFFICNPRHGLRNPKFYSVVSPAADPINHPAHYTSGKVECIDAIESALTPEEFRGYLKGNIIKYTWREGKKGGRLDIGKAQFYINRLADHD